MATGRKVEEQTLIYRGKENVKAENGVTYRCLIFSLVEYDKKGKEKEVITFFVTDDLNHLPVRLDLFLNFGSAKAFLNSVTGNRHPLTSIVKLNQEKMSESRKLPVKVLPALRFFIFEFRKVLSVLF